MFRELQQIDAVTKADIRRVAQHTFVDSNRTVARIETQQASAPPEDTPSPASGGKGGAR
jgi:predicted Zn-dependent peptidase